MHWIKQSIIFYVVIRFTSHAIRCFDAYQYRNFLAKKFDLCN